MRKVKLGIDGASGRMGKSIIELAEQDFQAGIHLKSLFARKSLTHPAYSEDKRAALTELDVLVDFTSAENTLANLKLCCDTNTALVIGTTGLDDAQELAITKAAAAIPILYAANMSLGVNLMMALLEQAAQSLGPEVDIEIIEAHHKHKKDAPSGTALALGKAIAKAKGWDFQQHANLSREGTDCLRREQEIGFATVRAGDIIGEHTALFASQYERLEITHKANSRKLFADGSLKAALYVAGKKAGLYTMRDLLGL